MPEINITLVGERKIDASYIPWKDTWKLIQIEYGLALSVCFRWDFNNLHVMHACVCFNSQAQSFPGTNGRRTARRRNSGPEIGQCASSAITFFLVLDVISLSKCSLSWIRLGNFSLPYGLVDNE